MRYIKLYVDYMYQCMDVNKIFNLFGESEEKNLNVIEDVFVDFKETPIYWIGMFKKIIQNNNIFSKSLQTQFMKSEYELSSEDIEEVGLKIGFNRGWDYISKINIKDKVHTDSISLNIDNILITSLEISIKYFQEIEEYEKCAHIKNILDFSKHFLT